MGSLYSGLDWSISKSHSVRCGGVGWGRSGWMIEFLWWIVFDCWFAVFWMGWWTGGFAWNLGFEGSGLKIGHLINVGIRYGDPRLRIEG